MVNLTVALKAMLLTVAVGACVGSIVTWIVITARNHRDSHGTETIVSGTTETGSKDPINQVSSLFAGLRRDITILGFIHKRVLQQCHPSLILFPSF